MTASLYAPFKAYVDASLISSASNFFDNSTQSILRELLQNSRRSGATRADLWQQGTRWKYSDNGPGCAPQDLLGLGASRWEAGVLDKESPAGCGFFSLARRHPTVTCPGRDWRVTMNERHFNGELTIEPESLGAREEVAEFDSTLGLVIEFDAASQYDYGLESIAKYMPIDFYMNGKKQECHVDFLGHPPGSIAHRVIQFSEFITVRVDILLGVSRSADACYHGWRVLLPDSARDYFKVGTTNGNYTARTRILVTRERELPLELPQRNKMVSNDTTKALSDLIRCTALELAYEQLQETSLASPSLWLDGRARGYTGPVLYPKFIGHLITRTDAVEMQDYSAPGDEDGHIYDVARPVTIDEFESGDFKCAPSKELLTLIAQTNIPFVEVAHGTGTLYDLDLEEYFAPGLRLVKPLESTAHFGHGMAEGHEAYAWAQRLRRLLERGHAWYEQQTLVASGTTEDGKPFGFEQDPACGLDADNLYDSIQLEFRSDDDTEEVILQAPALFELAGVDYDSRINFIVTKAWLDAMPAGFPDDVACAAYRIRKISESDNYDDEDRITPDGVAEQLREKFAKFAGLADFYKQRILDAATMGVEAAIYNLDPKPGCVVITLPITSSGSYVNNSKATCELHPPYQAYYEFEGSHGRTSCDIDGNRDPNEITKPGTDAPAYPEYHSFDVPTMQRLGIAPGAVDIVDACGWHDATKRIYVTPALPHLLWSAGCLREPSYTLAKPAGAVRAGMIKALKEGKISSDLYSALWYESPQFVSTLVGEVMEFLPPIRKLWIFEEDETLARADDGRRTATPGPGL